MTSKGLCGFCGAVISKGNMRRHLDSCRERKMRTPSKGRTRFFHIVVEDEYAPEYWLHLDVRGSSKLEELDQFLRDIWLECCGHLSMFTINGKNYFCASYMEEPNDPVRDLSMNFKVEDVVRVGMKFKYEYDFGTTTTLRLRAISERTGAWRKAPVLLIARNIQPEIACDVCGAKADVVCTCCEQSPYGYTWLCNRCASSHKCNPDYLLPVVNSPRTGLCGFTGGNCPLIDIYTAGTNCDGYVRPQ